MGKVILILDEMPETCYDCQLVASRADRLHCPALKREVGQQSYVDAECPLRAMPERHYYMDILNEYPHLTEECGPAGGLEQSLYDEGWNNCLNRIEGIEND